MIKECKMCKESKDISDFPTYKTYKSTGIRSYCKPCYSIKTGHVPRKNETGVLQKMFGKSHHSELTEEEKVEYRLSRERKYRATHKKEIRDYFRNFHKRRKQELVDRLGGKCIDCGWSGPLPAFDFHHKDSTQKDFNLSKTYKKMEEVIAEIDKCVLLCSNCHRVRHWGEKVGSAEEL